MMVVKIVLDNYLSNKDQKSVGFQPFYGDV